MGNFWIVPLLHSVSNTLRKIFASKQEEVTGDWLVYPSLQYLSNSSYELSTYKM
jgi:hypothetical protein